MVRVVVIVPVTSPEQPVTRLPQSPVKQDDCDAMLPSVAVSVHVIWQFETVIVCSQLDEDVLVVVVCSDSAVVGSGSGPVVGLGSAPVAGLGSGGGGCGPGGGGS